MDKELARALAKDDRLGTMAMHMVLAVTSDLLDVEYLGFGRRWTHRFCFVSAAVKTTPA
jgi:hypothetical protein